MSGNGSAVLGCIKREGRGSGGVGGFGKGFMERSAKVAKKAKTALCCVCGPGWLVWWVVVAVGSLDLELDHWERGSDVQLYGWGDKIFTIVKKNYF